MQSELTRLIDQFDGTARIYDMKWEVRITAEFIRELDWEVLACELVGVHTDSNIERFSRPAEINLATLSVDEIEGLHALI